MDETMCGLDDYGHDEPYVGFDYMSLLKGGAGMLQGAGGLLSGGKGGAPADAERIRLEMEKQQAESSARTAKIAAIVVGALAAVGITIAVVRK